MNWASRLSAAMFALMVLAIPIPAQPPGGAGAEKPKLGLHLNDSRAFQGYTLLAPMMSKMTYLLDLEGKVVRKWQSDGTPALSAYLLENGNLLRPCTLPERGFAGPGAGGRIQEFTWDGDLVWDYRHTSDNQIPHHDICRLPNGNVLMIAWDRKTAKDALAAGRRPETVGDSHLNADCVLEIQPTGKTTGKVVWEWHAWDHLIQEFDPSKANYGNVGEHPELIDLNFGEGVLAAMIPKKEELEKLKAIGYVGSTTPAPGRRINPDWTHINSIAYNAKLDQILLSVHEFSEIWVIDHSTTTAQAASHKGGKYGKGGDLLYRWGNPRAYRAGGVKDQKLFSQHNADWIPKGSPGEGNILVFNNGLRRPGGAHSTVDEIVPPVDAAGVYALKPGTAYGPEKAVWTYAAPKRTDFYSTFISGAQRLPNGNTLICSGINGTLFEVTADKEMVWKYVNPSKPDAVMPMPMGGPPQLGQILPGFLQGTLNLTGEQKKEAETFQKELGTRLRELLTDEQQKLLREPPRGPGFPGGPPRFGELLPKSQIDRLKLTDEQKEKWAEEQKAVDDWLSKFLTEDQQEKIKDLRRTFVGFGPPPGGPGGRPGPGGLAGPGGFGPPGGMFGGPAGGASVFRAYRYSPKYPGLAGRTLTPGKTVEELEAKDPPKDAQDRQPR